MSTSKETIIESPALGLKETPLRCLNSGSTPSGPAICISTVSDFLPIQDVIQTSGYDPYIIYYDIDGDSYYIDGNYIPTAVMNIGNGGMTNEAENVESVVPGPFFGCKFMLMGTQDTINPGGGYAPGVQNFPDVTSNPQQINYYISDLPAGTWDISGQVAIPAGTIIDGYNEASLDAIAGTLTLTSITTIPNDGSTKVVKGFAVYPANGAACICFCPSLIPGTISYHDVVAGGMLSPAVFSEAIPQIVNGTTNDVNWTYGIAVDNGITNPSYGGVNSFHKFVNGPGAASLSFAFPEVIAQANPPPAALYDFKPPSVTMKYWPVPYNYSVSGSQVICLWIGLPPSALPTTDFDPATFSLMVCK